MSEVQRRKVSPVAAVTGVVGEILITLGLILLLFIVWQVWWTDIGAHREQAAQVERVLEEWGTPQDAGTEQKVGEARFDDPPEFAPVGHGDVMGIIRIPRFGDDYANSIVEGSDMAFLNSGAFGHYEETQLPGAVGNFALAAHRQTYGAALRDVEELQPGDPIIVQTENAYLIYKKTDDYIVFPEEADALYPVPRQPGVEPTQRLLTLTTCHPPFVSNQRWIVHAEFDHWVDPKDGIPAELVKEG